MVVEAQSLISITVNEYQYKALAKSAANQPISIFFQRPMEPIRSKGTDHIKSATPNPYVVARFSSSATFFCAEIAGSLLKAIVQKTICKKAARPLVSANTLIHVDLLGFNILYILFKLLPVLQHACLLLSLKILYFDSYRGVARCN